MPLPAVRDMAAEDWITLPAAAALLGWQMPPADDQKQQFERWIRDGKIRYRPVSQAGQLVLIQPRVNFETSTATVLAAVTRPSWELLRKEKRLTDIPFLVSKSDVLRQASITAPTPGTTAAATYGNADEPLISKMRDLMRSKGMSIPKAAKAVALEAKGGGTFESRSKRLERRFRKQAPPE